MDYTPNAFYNDEAYSWYAYDVNGRRHWSDTKRVAECAAVEANAVIAKHNRRCPEDAELDDWNDEQQMYGDLRHGG